LWPTKAQVVSRHVLTVAVLHRHEVICGIPCARGGTGAAFLREPLLSPAKFLFHKMFPIH
jgi:hypothetical protein